MKKNVLKENNIGDWCNWLAHETLTLMVKVRVLGPQPIFYGDIEGSNPSTPAMAS